MKGSEVLEGDLHATERNKEKEHSDDVLMGDDNVFNEEDEEIWLQNQDHELLVDLNGDSSLFYTDLPSLPDFPRISSSSSSCSTPTPVKSMVCSSASASSSVAASSSSSTSGASWTVLRADAEEEDPHHTNRHQGCDFSYVNNNRETADTPALSTTDPMEIPQQSSGDAMETFECMDFFDPSSIFNPDENLTFSFDDFSDRPENPEIQMQEMECNNETHHHLHHRRLQEDFNGGGISSEGNDLRTVFVEWLKSNKNSVSAEYLRNIKIPKSTIGSAAKKLGSGKEGMKQLFKLILEWVQTNHLPKRRFNPITDPNLNTHPFPAELHPNNQCYPQSPWIHNPDYISIGNGDPNTDPQPQPPFNGDYNHMLNSTPAWSPSQVKPPFQDAYARQVPGTTGYGSTQYPCPTIDNNNAQYYDKQHVCPDQKVARLPSSVTKEARKKRMAKQRRLLSNHRNPAGGGGGDGEVGVEFDNDGNPAMNWDNGAAGVQQIVDHPAPPPHATGQGPQYSPSSERRQFLLQKVLKQSDVGSLGRIVLPKKEAETYLPLLDARDGITIEMEDIVTSRVWNMRYRFWPNNKSRMYVLENTGDFVKTNGLKEGDFIVIYSDVKCGKYLIRGVKLRQEWLKWENIKIGGRSQRNYQSQKS